MRDLLPPARGAVLEPRNLLLRVTGRIDCHQKTIYASNFRMINYAFRNFEENEVNFKRIEDESTRKSREKLYQTGASTAEKPEVACALRGVISAKYCTGIMTTVILWIAPRLTKTMAAVRGADIG